MKEMDIEKDLIFKMPPKKQYKIELNINNIKQAIPKFFSEDFKIEDKDIKRQDRH